MPKTLHKRERAYARLEGWGRAASVAPHASRRIAARCGCGTSCARVALRCSSAWGRAGAAGRLERGLLLNFPSRRSGQRAHAAAPLV